MEQCVFLALPLRPQPGIGRLPASDTITLVRPSARGNIRVARSKCPILTLNFNRLWALALNGRAKDGLTHWAMCHDDITPVPLWIDTLLDEMARHDADVMSAVVPIKDGRGLTSTGVRNVATGNIRRLTMREVFRLPETFGAADVVSGSDEILIVNTGLWVCRFTEKWAEPPAFPGFTQLDGMVRLEDGRFMAATLSEDWCFSEWASRQRLKVMATRKVPLSHMNDAGEEFRNDSPWGEWDTDRGDESNE